MFYTVLLSQIVLAPFCQSLRYEPSEEDLTCFNDYETEMKCSLPSDGLTNSSTYKLNIEHKLYEHTLNTYTCTFERCHHGDTCAECRINVQGFVPSESFSVTLLEGTHVLLNREFMTEDIIKPKSPVLSVQKTENGNFKVTWDDKYENRRTFAESLRITLTYGIKGGHETMSKEVVNTAGVCEIVSYNLQPNTDYILTAKMTTDYNDHKISSDQSEPLQFTTPSSPNRVVTMVLTPVCVGLIIIICAVFICILRIKTNWWNKISKPKIDASFAEEMGHILPPSCMKFSPIHVEIPKPDLQPEKEIISSLSVDTNHQKSSQSVESSPVDYGEACSDFGNEKMNNITFDIQSHITQAMREDLKLCIEQALHHQEALKFPHGTGQEQHDSWAASLHSSPVIQIDTSYHAL